ncbi:hypothetical protein LTR84_009955 [Exophiala bonariae]|uniref:BRCT domain-containing protein n=1 Tax=Exophiala bonariae TaxID=1690606 RepID=A0AAV9NNY4_9EURO|nr:hypothetical protein LTR84_009955 [Exophiala bonariae]
MAISNIRASAERPLHGAILCFTSVAPEQRTQYADAAIQMGAEHTLDLTSQTTHLIVGSTESLKYSYVARERDDIKVLRPEWIDALRELWMNDHPINLDQLAQEYRMPTLTGLKICITGFEDLAFRAQLQKNVVENGGEYTGDLTKDVTHLIAAKPEGKKYEYGMTWQKKVVSLKWYKDTLERGMQLEERLYHPTIPVTEQGRGAWNRNIRPSPKAIKRPRETVVGGEPSRKLRRTASARLGSQNENLWTDIVGGPGLDDEHQSQRQLKVSKSMSSLPKTVTPIETAQEDQVQAVARSVGNITNNTRIGFFSGHSLKMCGFVGKKENIVRNILLENGATITNEQAEGDGDHDDDVLILLPHDIAKTSQASIHPSNPTAVTVSELWLEQCMFQKRFVNPQDYPLGKIIEKSLMPDFSKLTINATGFGALETLHTSKMVTLLGGKYVEILTPTVGMLLCKSGSSNQQKLGLAKHFNIPVVTESWLYQVLETSRNLPLDKYLVQPFTNSSAKTEAAKPSHRSKPDGAYVEVSTIPLKSETKSPHGKHPDVRPSRQKGSNMSLSGDAAIDGSFTYVHRDSTEEPEKQVDHDSNTMKSENSNSTNREALGDSFVWVEPPLKEVNANSPIKKPRGQGDKSDTKHLHDDNHCKQNSDQQTSKATDHPCQGKDYPAEDMTEKATSVLNLNGAIRELLDQQNRKKHTTTNASNENLTKGRLIGRALSNLSNTSNTRISRAGSVDSMNTDGIGSEIASMPPGKQSTESASGAEKSGFSLMGRAKSTLSGIKSFALGLHDPDMVRGDFQREDDTPQMTQLGYEDPEEAIILRQKLAESRRTRSKQGAKEIEPKPVVQQKKGRKIKDDDVLADAGWGAGRRTRNKPKSPPNQEIAKF